MKRLILMRHAKSSWADPGQRDIDRPLSQRGRAAAELIGDWLARSGYGPDHGLVSSATRTRETWDILASRIGTPTFDPVPALYHAEPEAILSVLRAAPEDNAVLILGHQPGLGEAAARLLAAPPEDAEFERHPTAATSIIDFDAARWREISWGSGRLVDFTVPRRLEPAT